MDNFNYTRGPWKHGYNGNGGMIIADYLDNNIAIAFPKNEVANACLISAAPELLEYLEKLIDVAYEQGVSGHLPIFELCHGAVSKARGKVYP